MADYAALIRPTGLSESKGIDSIRDYDSQASREGGMTSAKRDFLVSVRPKYASQIFSGAKTVELRRRFPVEAAAGATILIYSSSPVRAIIGYATIKSVLRLAVGEIWRCHGTAACISKKDFDSYFLGLKFGFVIVLTNVKMLKKQMDAAAMQQKFGIVPPQSYRYVSQHCTNMLSNEQIQRSNRYKRYNRA